MFCNNCKSARPENEAPCPNCGAPSSLLGKFQAGGWGAAEPVSTAWSASATSFNQQWNNQEPQFSPGAQPSFYTGQSWPQVAGLQQQPMSQQPSWGVSMMSPVQEQQEQSPQSLLPVPYTGDAQQHNPPPGEMQLMPFQQQMLPAIPDEQLESVYVPPMYTKPRPLIPRYRIISGMLSVVIVSLLLCGGGAYYAQSNGLFTNLGRMMGVVRPPNVNAAQNHTIPDPPQMSAIPGPASAIITSATTTLHTTETGAPREADTILQVNVPFYVTFNVQPPKPGNIMIKWYMNGNYYKTSMSDQPIDPRKGTNNSGSISMIYSIPATGIAELYWQGQGEAPKLGQKLYFSVR